MSRRPRISRIKIHRSYTVEQAAEVLDVTVGTVRGYIRDGLNCLKEQKPFLLLGFEVKNFLKARYGKKGRKLKKDELYCCSCKAPRKPLGMMVDYIPINEERGRIQAICETCGSICNRIVSARQRVEMEAIFDFGPSSKR